jgi:hypothetical protein
VVVIAVNARSDSDTGTDASKDVPGLLSVVNAVVGIPIDATTAYSNASLVSLRDDLRRAAQDAETLMVPGNPLFRSKAYDITIDFDQFRVGQNTMRDKVKEIGTTWTLSPAEIRLTMCAGRMLLWQHPQFQELLMELGASPRPRNADPMCEPEIP